MKRIGILTFHRAHNYGAILQAYALQEYLKGQGHNVQFIDYKSKHLLEVYKLISLRRISTKNPFKFAFRIYQELRSYPIRFKRSKGFNTFINSKLNVDPIINHEHINNKFDIVLIGSDQVWNFHLTGGFDPFYWGSFKRRGQNLKVASYAASMEMTNLSKEELANVAQLINNFDEISVREHLLKSFLEKIANRNINVVVDPTLLIDKSIWDNIAVKPKQNKPYLLLYQVRNSEQNILLAKKIANKLNIDVVYLSARTDAINSPDCVGASPAEYLGLFKYASFIICSSFHGTVFSILFQVPFYTILMNDGKDTRNISLLQDLGLIERGIKYNQELKDTPIEWQLVKDKLQKMRGHSIHYLNKVLS